MFTKGQKVRFVGYLNDTESDVCKVGDIGTYVGNNDGTFGYVHVAEFAGGTDSFLAGELVAVAENEVNPNAYERLVELLNKHIVITESESDGECLLSVDGKFRNEGNEAMAEFIFDMMAYIDGLLPEGYTCYCGDDGFEIRKEE